MTPPGLADPPPDLPEIVAGAVQLIPGSSQWEVRAAVGGELLGRIRLLAPADESGPWRLEAASPDPLHARTVADAALAAQRYLAEGAGLTAAITPT
jgi:hypothetical protein